MIICERRDTKVLRCYLELLSNIVALASQTWEGREVLQSSACQRTYVELVAINKICY
jgi:hypothetical protein